MGLLLPAEALTCKALRKGVTPFMEASDMEDLKPGAGVRICFAMT